MSGSSEAIANEEENSRISSTSTSVKDDDVKDPFYTRKMCCKNDISVEEALCATPGTILRAVAENKAIDGAGLFRGVLRGKEPCRVLVLSYCDLNMHDDNDNIDGAVHRPTTVRQPELINKTIEMLCQKKG